MNPVQEIAREIKRQIDANSTRTSRGKVTAVNGGEVSFTVGGSAVARRGRWVGVSQPQVGDVITYIDEPGRDYPLVTGGTGPRDLHVVTGHAIHVGALAKVEETKVSVGGTEVTQSGVSVGTTNVTSSSVTANVVSDGQGDLRAAINSLTSRVVSLEGSVASHQNSLISQQGQINDIYNWIAQYGNPTYFWAGQIAAAYNAHTTHPPNNAPSSAPR